MIKVNNFALFIQYLFRDNIFICYVYTKNMLRILTEVFTLVCYLYFIYIHKKNCNLHQNRQIISYTFERETFYFKSSLDLSIKNVI